MLLLGIDDAGRGPVIGPMVLAGCLIEEKTKKEFREKGVRDSKQLTQKRREFLEEFVKEKSKKFHTVLLTPEEIDKGNEEGTNLNQLEAIAAAKIINKLNSASGPDGTKISVILDCPSASINKWTEYLKTHIENLSNLEIVCEHKADRNHVVVSAASILAKSERERQVARLREKYGEDMGSGYPSDPKTKEFLANNATKHKGLFRKSWSTWKKASSKLKQKKLF